MSPDEHKGLGVISNPENLGSGNPSTAQADWITIRNYGEVIKFLYEAFEWENMLYFLYPYFWDLPNNWTDLHRITHPDPLRQAFLRAGSARVVLTVRPGFETDLAKLMQNEAWSRHQIGHM